MSLVLFFESVLIQSLCCPQIAPLPTRTCVSGTWTKVWSAASPATAWCWPTLSAAATTVEAGALNATLAHTGIQVNKMRCQFHQTSNFGDFIIIYLETRSSSAHSHHAQRCSAVCATCTWKQSQTESQISLLSSPTTNQVSRSSFFWVSDCCLISACPQSRFLFPKNTNK